MAMDATAFDEILQEARACFLYEDAPDYIAVLEQGMQRLIIGTEAPAQGLQVEYTALMRAAHSLKGGAGLAQLHSLSQLAHKLEDLLEALHEDRIPAQETAYELLALGVEQVKDLVADATSGRASAMTSDLQAASSLPILAALDDFLQDLPKANSVSDSNLEANSIASAIDPRILKAALEVDLEDCLQRVEGLLQQSVRMEILKQALTGLVEECILLGQTLNLAWLVSTSETVSQELVKVNPDLKSIATKTISQLRDLRSQALAPTPQPPSTSSLVEATVLEQVPQEAVIEQVASSLETQRFAPSSSGDFPEPAQGKPLSSSNAPVPAQSTHVTPTLNLRIPVARLNRMSDTLGELLIEHERLSLHQSQLGQANWALKKEAQRLNPINEQVRLFYDRLATSDALSLGRINSDDDINCGSGGTSFENVDSLQFDRYTDIHSTLQDFQEVMVRVQETRADIDLINRDLQEALDRLRQQLNSLRGDLTESRLVPFKLLAERFISPLQTFNQRYHKSVELEIEGKETLIDQVILEQLQTPITHLLRNAFDHGIETPEERLALGKPEKARITLSAVVQGNQAEFVIADDGRGINLEKVHQRAVQMSLCRSDIAVTPEQILEFLFAPGFSTASTVTDLSGRGVGLDVVHQQIERLRGLVQVETKLKQGTKFTISVPLTLNILPLLLCRCQQRTLAIPSLYILEIIALSEFCDPASVPATLVWQNRQAPLFSLADLLPYSRQDVLAPSVSKQLLGIVLEINGGPVVVAVDSLLKERELVLKPFDATVKVPAYIAGCTVLGTGEVVPVLSPDRFGELIAQTGQTQPTPNQVFEQQQDGLELVAKHVPTILIVDDSVTVRRLLNRMLDRSGYRVVQCRDGKEALETLNRSGENFDLVISDIELPRLDGFSLLREIRSHPRWHSLAVAILTSRENEHHRQKAQHLGATAYFAKPFQPAELLTSVSAMLF